MKKRGGSEMETDEVKIKCPKCGTVQIMRGVYIDTVLNCKDCGYYGYLSWIEVIDE